MWRVSDQGKMTEMREKGIIPRMDERVIAAVAGSVFGYSAVRGHQMRMAQAVLAGQDCMALLPTSAGKSLGYHLPQVCAPERGMALVIEPTIALMRDQGERLRLAGVEAVEIHSSATPDQARRSLEAALANRASFLHLSPECLANPYFRQRLSEVRLAYVVVDEAHCIDMWGHDFRPEYGRLGELIASLPRVPILACSATLTPSSASMVERVLGLKAPVKVAMSTFRKNIARAAVELGSREECDAFAVRAAHYYAPRGRCLIYVQTIRKARELSSAISETGLPAGTYHSQLDGGSRVSESARFRNGELPVMVATAAYGMGVDIPGLRTVVHAGLPGSVEAYVQESGRAGRAPDEQAYSVVGWSQQDRGLHQFFRDRAWPSPDTIANPSSERESAHVNEWLALRGITLPLTSEWAEALVHYRQQWDLRLDAITDALRKPGCLNRRLLSHFGEAEPEGPCGACSACLSSSPATDNSSWPLDGVEGMASVSPGGPKDTNHAERLMRLWMGGTRRMDGRAMGALARLPADPTLAQEVGVDANLARRWADWASANEPWMACAVSPSVENGIALESGP